MRRLVNTSETKPYSFDYNGLNYMFQPKKGRFKQVTIQAPHPYKEGRTLPSTQIICENPDAQEDNWLFVPDDLAEKILKPSDFRNKHAGDIVPAEQHEEELKRTSVELAKKNAELEKRLAELEQNVKDQETAASVKRASTKRSSK